MSKYTPFNTVDDYKIKLQEAKITLGFSPTADVVEVRHGRWINNHCTVCGQTPIGEEAWTRRCSLGRLLSASN